MSRIYWFSEKGGHCRGDQGSATSLVMVDTWGDTCMVTFCVGDLQCDRFSCFIFIIKHCSINFIGVMFYCHYMFNICILCLYTICG